MPAHAADDELHELTGRLEAAEFRIQELEQLLYRDAEQPAVLSTAAQSLIPMDWSSTDSEISTGSENALWSADEWLRRQNQIDDELKATVSRSVRIQSPGTLTMRLRGRIHTDYWGFPHTTSGINQLETLDPNRTPQDQLGLRRLRFGADGNVSSRVRYRFAIELAGGDESEFRDVWIAVDDLSAFGTVTIGNQKRPYGLDHLNSSNHNIFLERPFVVESFNRDARRLGISARGHSDDLSWNWLYGFWNLRLIQSEGQYISDHLQGEIAGRLAHTWWYDKQSHGRNYAHCGISATVAHPDGSTLLDPVIAGASEARNTAEFSHRPEARSSSRWLNTGRIIGADWYELVGIEQVFNFGSLQIAAEYQNLFMQRDPGFRDVHLHGGYLYVAWLMTGEHVPWNRKTGTLGAVTPHQDFFAASPHGTGWGAWQVAARYSYADFNDGSGAPLITSEEVYGGVGEAVSIALNWIWNTNTRVQVNYLSGSIDNRNLLGNLVSGDYRIIGARCMIYF